MYQHARRTWSKSAVRHRGSSRTVNFNRAHEIYLKCEEICSSKGAVGMTPMVSSSYR